MKPNVTPTVKRALDDLDSYDPVLRTALKKVFDGYMTWTFRDMVTVGMVDRAMKLIYGFTTLVKNDNFSAARHLIRLHMDNYLRYNVLWLTSEPDPLAKRIYEGEQLNQIPFALKPKRLCYTDEYLAKQAAIKFPRVYDEYKKHNRYVHLSQQHIFDASEVMDEEQMTTGLLSSKFDMTVSEKDRIDGIALMKEITLRLLELLEDWSNQKVKKREEQGENTLPGEFDAFTLAPMKDFTYQHEKEINFAGVIIYTQDGYKRYRVSLNKSEALIIAHCGFTQTSGKLIWVQEMRPGILEYPHDLVQHIGEGIEKCDWWVQAGSDSSPQKSLRS